LSPTPTPIDPFGSVLQNRAFAVPLTSPSPVLWLL
jgi:hypothetical protein